jgi:crotonobetainyl-CoA:carnitine CoA-transferase CaiB-like acyl-CoA transferase
MQPARARTVLGLAHRPLTRPQYAPARGVATASDSPPPPKSKRSAPLAGVKVLELGQLIAGPFCGQLLAHFGADVIKVEPPGAGDPLRVWRELDEDGVSPWFRSLARNKRSVTLDLRQEKGREIARKLAAKSDVLIEK